MFKVIPSTCGLQFRPKRRYVYTYETPKTTVLMGTFAVARNSLRFGIDYVLNTGCLFHLTAVKVGHLATLRCHACGLSAESTHVNTIKEPTGSGYR
jgi:hypothetical protein